MTSATGYRPGAGADRWTSTAEAEAAMAIYLSPLTGIVRRVHERMHDVDDLYAHSMGSETCDSRLLLGAPCNKGNGGWDASHTGARLAAIGEGVERYSAAWVPEEALRYGSAEELTDAGLTCLQPAQLTLFADWQFGRTGFPYVPFTAATRLWWTESRRLHDGAPVWLPAQLTYLRNNLPDDSRIGYPTSSGLAFANTPAEAAVSGILELVERDAFMLAWHHRLSLPLLDPGSDPALAELIRRHATPSGLDFHLVDLSVFTGIPAMLGVVRNRASELAPIGLGAAAAGSPRRAAAKTLFEAFSTRTWAWAQQREGQVVAPHGDYDKTVRDFEDHVGLYTSAEMVPGTEFLTASPHRRALAELPALPDGTPGQLLSGLVSTLAEQGVDLLAVDVTSPDVREAGGHVVKVFSPQLQPLDVGFQQRMLGGRRLRELPVALGLTGQVDTEHLNPLPHPFP
ncbi:YcaO-like family protein [Crossiella cryophila]|uniref:Ribosomal protein S12 methylthiotransferase accessory factor n=1 Tax=Crossiella cryophila TaxID=43355 RepID=A0A7W7FXN5_9PSEU|nr:YcaO-like family protein [Crossiella cryophila]MBB4680828.1 ribosomal protein S12 methylthiotransferase accessory factor [Crossiella cryophila]